MIVPLVISEQWGDFMNKKKIIIIIVAVAVAIATVSVLCFMFISRSAFAGIQKEDIASVEYHIQYYENNEPVFLPLPEENLDELLDLMHNISIKGFADKNGDKYAGGSAFMFRALLKNGEQIEFSAQNPHMEINGKYYRSEYEQTDALYQFWRELVLVGRKEYGLDT